MSDTTEKSAHQKKVEKFVEYLNTQLLEIPQRCWFNFSVECMELIDKCCVEDSDPLPSFSTGFAPNYNMQAAQGASNYGYSHGHATTSYSKRSHYAATPRQYGSQMYGGASATTGRNEPL